MSAGTLIALEGLSPARPDLLRRLQAELVAARLPVKLLAPRRQAEDMATQLIATILDDDRYATTPRGHSLLSNALTANQHDTLQKLLAAGTVCLMGRSSLADLVLHYYGLGTVSDYNFLRSLSDFAAAGVAPDLTIVLDTTATEQAVAGLAHLGVPGMADAALFERMRAGYLWEAKQHDFPVIYVTDDTDVAFEQIWQQVSQHLGVTSSGANPSNAQSIAEVLAAHPPQKSEPKPEPELPQPANKHAADQQPTSQPRVPTQESLGPVSALAAAYVQLADRAADDDFDSAYDQKDDLGHFRYYIPPALKGKVRSHYIRTINQIFETYANMLPVLKDHCQKAGKPEHEAYGLLRDLLPLAATGHVRLSPGHPQVSLPEALPETKPLTPAVSADASSGVLTSLAEELLPPAFAAETDATVLTDYAPRNELDLASSMLFAYADIPTGQLEKYAADWTYQQKVDILTAYRANVPRPALDGARYTFDLITSFTTIQRLLAKPYLQGIRWQVITPRLGYEVPRIIEEADLSDGYERCFDLSLELASAVHAAHGPIIAQYAALQGHKVRWSCSFTGRQLYEMVRSLSSLQRADNGVDVVQQMFEKVVEVHPLLAEAVAASHTARQLDDPRPSA